MRPARELKISRQQFAGAGYGISTRTTCPAPGGAAPKLETYSLPSGLNVSAVGTTSPVAKAAADSRDDAIWQLGCTAHLLATNGKYRHAEEDIDRMLEFDPKSAMLVAELGCVNYYAGNLDDSIRYYRQALADDPHSVLANWGIGRALGLKGRYKEALETLEQFKAAPGVEPPVITAEIGYVKAVSGDRQGAEGALKQLAAESKHIYVDKFLIATIYLGLNDREKAYALLDQAFEERSSFLVSLASDPKWAGWRDDAHFHSLWTKMTENAHHEPGITAMAVRF